MRAAEILITALTGYFFGCIQTAYFLGKLYKNLDIREFGSNNAGASNVTALMGWKYGVFTALIDIFKSLAAVTVIRYLFPGYPVLMFIAGAFVLLGHIFPFFLGFKGGKGVASLVGMMLGIDLRIGLIIGFSLIIITLIFDYIALGSITIYIAAPIIIYFFRYGYDCIIVVSILTFIGLYKHMINIKRMVMHEEKGLRAVVKNTTRL